MDQVSNAVLNLLQEITKIQQPVKEAQKDTKFEDLLNQRRQDKRAEGTAEEKPAEKVSEKKEDPEAAVEKPTEEQEATWREQMVMAAMAIQPVSVVPAETVEAQSAAATQAAAAEEISQVAVPAQTVEAAAPEQQPKAVTGTQQPQVETQETQAEAKAAPVETETVAETTAGTAPRERAAEAKPVQRHEDGQELEVKVEDVPQERVFGEVETAPVKVGETTELGESQQAESVEKQVMEPLNKALERGDAKVEIQLKPANLGSVTIEVTRREDGTLHVLLSAENPRTLSLLDKHAADLQTALYQQSQEPVRVVVDRQEPQQRELDYQQEQGQHSQQQEQHRQQSHQDSQDFLQQLRLGLTPLDSETF